MRWSGFISPFMIAALAACCFLFQCSTAGAEEENLNIFERWISWRDGGHMLIEHLNRQASVYLDRRDSIISQLATREDWALRRNTVKDNLMKIVGPFPEKKPLNGRITGILQNDGYRIEKIIYESMPGFYVTSCLFIPDNLRGKTPVIVHVSGHAAEAFRSTPYQALILNLVRKGFIVFAIDPVGQGERQQYADAHEKVPQGSSEHSYFGNQCFITGISSARYFIWDIIRGIDYLHTRDEVDTERIGIAGRSGGGTQSAYAMAFDDRIKAAAPESYITGFRRLLESIGAQDAEQIFYHGLVHGITHADFIEVRAPRPCLIVTLTRDYFSIQGARETYREALKAYTVLGSPTNLRMAEDDNVHMSTPANREAVYRFFQDALEFPGDSRDEAVSIIEPEELNVTDTGQVLTSLGGETVFSINRKESEERIRRIRASRMNVKRHTASVRERAGELSGYIKPEGEGEPVFRGRYPRDGYCVEMYALKGEGACVVPLLVFVPEGAANAPSMVYLHPGGKGVDAGAGGRIERLVRQGFIVAAADPLGTGETADSSRTYVYAAEYEAILLGRSIAGIQAGDIIRAVNYLKSRKDTDKSRIGAVAFGALGPALLHAAVFDESISRVVLAGAPLSYSAITLNRFYNMPFECAVAGALTAYDLADLAACIAPRRLLFASPQNHLMEPAAGGIIDSELEFPMSVYKMADSEDHVKVIPDMNDMDFGSLINWWNAE